MRKGFAPAFTQDRHSLRSNAWRVLGIAAALLFVQLAATLHGLHHVIEDTNHAPHTVCEVCFAYAHIGDGLTSSNTPFLGTAAPVSFLILPAVQSPPARPASPYQVRAPPLLS